MILIEIIKLFLFILKILFKKDNKISLIVSLSWTRKVPIPVQLEPGYL